MKQKRYFDQNIHKKKQRHQKLIITAGIILSLVLILCICFLTIRPDLNQKEPVASGVQMVPSTDIPEYNGDPYIELNGNQPSFSEKDLTTEVFEHYSELDALGRCGTASAKIGPETMPNEERGPIGEIQPSGWQVANYHDLIDGNYLYNRCHLIAFSLSGENANGKNLITGTRYLNTEGMQPFELEVLDYIRETGNHVLYRVTPIFEGDNLIASGVEMDALSVEDQGAGICFHVFAYNVQPGVIIDYRTGIINWIRNMTIKTDLRTRMILQRKRRARIQVLKITLNKKQGCLIRKVHISLIQIPAVFITLPVTALLI